jgi:hypothetical protein
MVRPRWHDAMIAVAIAGVVVIGVWALWWEDVLGVLGIGGGGSGESLPPVTPGNV